MASGFYNSALYDIPRGSIDLDTTTIKAILTGTAGGGYTYNPDHVFVEEAANDVNEEELTGVSGYTRGFAGAGRKTVTITGQANNTDNRGDFAVADLTWSTLGAGDTIAYLILVQEVSADTDSKLIAAFDVTDTPTNGGDVTFDYNTLAAGGNLRFAA
jgi:hypothetical protein